MRDVSERWRETLLGPHTVAIRVRETSSQEDIPVTGGSVTLDSTASYRATGDITVEDPGFAPLAHDDLLAPYGNELEVCRGIQYEDTEEPELVRLGVLRVEEAAIASGTQCPLADRAAFISDAKFEDDYTVTGGTDYLTAMQDILNDAGRAITYAFPERDVASNTLIASRGDDRWEFVRGMAAFLGMELYFDGDGICTMRVVPVPSGAPVAYLIEGQDGVTVSAPSLTAFEKRISRADSHNKWIVVGDNPDVEGAPPVGIAIDDDPDSPTYYYGNFGRKPEIFTSPFVVDETQAEDAAEGKRAKESGLTSSVNFGAFVDPALEPGDLVRITRTMEAADGTLIELADEDHIIDSLTIPLDAASTMTGVTRASRI